jgi:sterol desaturase/sphingolipid hydroxylase (fatty acid hydroxylase superfamily)
MEIIAPVIMLGSYLGFIVYEAVNPARKFARVPWWRIKGILFFVMMVVVSTVLPFAYDGFMQKHALLNLSGLGTIGGAVVGYVAFQLAAYWWHRLMHTAPFLWRWSHQMHHSAERVDIWGVALFHPFDIAGFTVLASVVLSLVLGVSPEAAALAGAYSLFAAIFQHANIRTPRWLGYIIQRPESHGIHHQRGVHAYNYSDLPLWDILFGTFRNPATWHAEGGFYDGSSKRLLAMLFGRDVSTPESNPMSSRPSLGEGARLAA